MLKAQLAASQQAAVTSQQAAAAAQQAAAAAEERAAASTSETEAATTAASAAEADAAQLRAELAEVKEASTKQTENLAHALRTAEQQVWRAKQQVCVVVNPMLGTPEARFLAPWPQSEPCRVHLLILHYLACRCPVSRL